MFTEEQSGHLEDVLSSKMEDCPLEFVWEEQDKEEAHGDAHELVNDVSL